MLVIAESPQTIDQALQILKDGGVVAHATETCYGLAADMTNPKAIERLFAIKERPNNQPVSALFASIEDAKKYVEWNDEAEALAQKYLPGPLTLILPLRQDAPQIFTIPKSESRIPNPSLGIRISSHPLAQELSKRFGKPLSTTSANIHGHPNPYSMRDMIDHFSVRLPMPDLIVNSGILEPKPSSTVIDLSSGKILRQGEALSS